MIGPFGSSGKNGCSLDEDGAGATAACAEAMVRV